MPSVGKKTLKEKKMRIIGKRKKETAIMRIRPQLIPRCMGATIRASLLLEKKTLGVL